VFLGPVDSHRLTGLYRNAIATLVPSITYETFGLTVVESFAVGTPVIARRLGPLPEIIRSCNGGFDFATDAELVTALSTLAHNTELRNQLGANGRRGYEACWSEAAVVPRYLELVQEATERRRK
jgi:glycosyltransferase involved in cell wall biosynthesis